ncbi:hypothetical protein DMN77_18540 [Paenibacillus sp. 79R4]|uniref:hemolysin XhlA family protein n=1 Tax=Paenibacillus sp. 79R4 TaxID=2212847 RepID=UPI0015BD9498|nr:hemolysin XhlA family protein [Paenibacillus sp. 79R4]NWL89550.1 hypothetical protein [Paenibacillus sp. 79R4]
MDDLQAKMLERVTRVEEKVDGMNEKLDRAIAANETAVAAQASAKSAHYRIDKIENSLTWLWRTFAGAFILAIAAFIIAGGLK